MRKLPATILARGDSEWYLNPLFTACISACVFFLVACSQKRPVLYPTGHLEQVDLV